MSTFGVGDGVGEAVGHVDSCGTRLVYGLALQVVDFNVDNKIENLKN